MRNDEQRNNANTLCQIDRIVWIKYKEKWRQTIGIRIRTHRSIHHVLLSCMFTLIWKGWCCVCCVLFEWTYFVPFGFVLLLLLSLFLFLFVSYLIQSSFSISICVCSFIHNSLNNLNYSSVNYQLAFFRLADSN